MQLNVPKLRKAIRSHPKLITKVLVTITKDEKKNKSQKYWYNKCVKDELYVMGYIANWLLYHVKRGFN